MPARVELVSGVYITGGRKALLASLRARTLDRSLADSLGVYFAIQCPGCGMVVKFERVKDIPVHSLPCQCNGGYILEYVRRPNGRRRI